MLPLGVVAVCAVGVERAVWAHLAEHVLPQALVNTAWLLLGVGLGTAVLGTLLAALVALCEFPGRRWLSWALLLPLAMPTYVLAVAAVGLLDYAAPLPSALRALGVGFPDIRSRGGVILVMTLALYPYVYLVARPAFASQGLRVLEVGRALGMGPFRAFLRASLPLARPWIAGGTLLVLMETLADFGAVAAFNYDTLTTAIYKAWFGLFSLDAALSVAGVLILLVLVLLTAESKLRAHREYTALGVALPRRLPLGRWRWLATAACLLVLALGFVLPLVQLLQWSWTHRHDIGMHDLRLAVHSVSLGLVAATMTITAAVLLAYAVRHQADRFTQVCARLATLGYALPGALLAVGLYVPLARGTAFISDTWGIATTVQTSLLLLVLAYGVRFLAVAHTPLAAALLRIRPSLDEAARLHGVRGISLIWKVHLPLLRGSLATAMLLVFVDVMKEMPITLMTRPFGWDTLAIRVFELTQEGEWARAAWPSLTIVLAGLLPVLWLDRGIDAGISGRRRAPAA
ncbi:iron(III) transport system permease protein [Fontimonas thermophila]|uniref:Iron(III) transport system permease protein n=2 Tax=Fontimonas thermophila TaxID=1076937 RepID=A0A1I2JE96_9GAMM|nr:iron(III) transport system permease protein [Fontimonas thermophila]